MALISLAAAALRDVPPARAAFLPPGESIVEALRLLTGGRAAVVLTTTKDAPAVVTRADLERLLPSPATSLNRYEVRDLMARIRVREAVTGPAPVVPADMRIAAAVGVMREWCWSPLVVLNGETLYGVVTVEAILCAAAGLPPP